MKPGHTLIHIEFHDYIQNKLSQRESELIKDKNFNTSATPEIVDIIKRSKAVSISKGKFHFLLRPVLRRKSKKLKEKENKKEEEEDKYPNYFHEKLEELERKFKGLRK